MEPNDNASLLLREIMTAEQTKELDAILKNGQDPALQAVDLFKLICESHVINVKASYFIRKKDREIIEYREFDARFNRWVNLIGRKRAKYADHAALFANSRSDLGLTQCSSVTYEPGKDDWIGNQYNTFRPAGYEAVEGRPTIFLDHMDYLFPDERERKLVLQFLAWCIRNPDKKIQHALLIIGRKGTGKSWLAKLLSVLFGPHNVSVLERGGVIADRFDTSAERKQLVFVDELVPDGKRDLIHAIEPLIVGTQVGIERKGKDRIWIPNRANIIAVTNKETAIRLTDSKDRKWLVVRAAEDARDSDYFKRLFAITPSDGTVTDEVRRVLWYLKTQVDLRDYDGLAPAPSTGTKDDVAESNQTSIAKQVSALRAGLLSQYTLVAFDDVRQLIATTTYAGDDSELTRQEADAKIAAAMEAEGCRRVRGEQAYLSKDRPKVRLWATSPEALEYVAGLRLAELAAMYRQEHEQPRVQGSIWFGTPGEPLSSAVPDFSEPQ